MSVKNPSLQLEAQDSTTTSGSEFSFIDTYKNYASLLTDAPEIYHEFSALNLLSLAVGRTPINVTPKQLYPNIWTILIGVSGVSRKSTALCLADSILPDNYQRLPNDFTPESLQECLSKQSQGFIIKEEIGGFLSSIKRKDFMVGTPDLLCQLYDCPSKYRKTLRRVDFKLADTCFNIMAATTPSRFLQAAEPEDFDSGFLSRFLIIYGKKSFALPRRRWDHNDTRRRDNCKTLWNQVYDVLHSGSQVHEFDFDPKALERADVWQTMKEEETLKIDDPEEADLKGAIITRLSDYVLKLSALYEVDNISKNIVSKLVDSQILISFESVEKACSTIDNLLTLQTENLLILLTKDNISKRLVNLTKVVRSKADSEGWIKHGKLLQLMNMSAYEFKLLLQTAFERELIEEPKHEGKATYYKLKSKEN
jgi:hypothetical protein